MRRFRYLLKLLRNGGVLCVGLLLAADMVMAQPPGGEGRPDRSGFQGGGGRQRGFGGFGFGGEPTLGREMRNETFAEKLNLSEEQKELLKEIDMETFEMFRGMGRGGGGGGGGTPEEAEKRRAEFEAKLKEIEAKRVAILTAEQKAIWEERKTELKAEQAARDAGRTRSDTPASTPAVTIPQTAPRRTVFLDEKPPEGVAPTASFSRSIPAGIVGGGGGGGGVATTADAAAPAKDGEATLSFNFRYAPWADVLKLFAEAANLTLDLNDVPPGTFNYYDSKSYTVTEALDVLNGYLLPKGYVLIRRDQFLVSLNIDNGIPPTMVPTIAVEELSKRGANELVIVDVSVDGFEAEKIATEVKQLVSPWGTVAALKGTNSLNIMDTSSNIIRIIRLLKAGAPVGSPENAFRAVPLKYITAVDAERTIRRLFGLNPPVTTATQQQQFGFSPFQNGFQFGGRGGRPDFSQMRQPQQQPQTVAAPSTPSSYLGKIQVTADSRTNHLLIAASATLVKVVEDAVKSIDVDTNSSGEKIVNDSSSGPAFLKAYAVGGGDVTQVSRTLNSIMPGLVVGEDTKAGKIHVQATREEHAEIERLIQTLAAGPSDSVAVINLTRTDPIQVTNTLRNLFTNDTNAPMIEADALGRRLLVRGSAEQLVQVRSLLQSLGEMGSNPGDEKIDRGPVRTMNLNGRNPQDVLPLIQKMWEAADRNPIRKVVPSQANPIRDRRTPSARPQDYEPSETNNSEGRSGDGVRPASRRAPTGDQSKPSAQIPRRSILQVSQSGEAREGIPARTLGTSGRDDNEPRDGNEPEADPPAAATKPAEENAPQVPASQSPISLSIVGGDVIVTSADKEALDQFEDMFNTLLAALPARTRWTIFYLRSADATETAQMLERLFPQSSVTASTTSNTGMFGSLTGGLSTLGRGMMNATGLNQTLGAANDLRIITDIRANALFVTGPEDQIEEVEAMLELLDSSQLPESLRDRIPRTIPVEYAEVDDVAEMLESAFKDSITADPAAAQAANAQRMNPFAMLMGGGGAQGGRKEQGVQLTIGVDRRTSNLIVVCNENLFRQIESVVKSMDERARDARQTVQIMRLATADPELVSSTLTSLIPKVTVTATRPGSRRNQPGDQQPQAGQPGGAQQPNPATFQRSGRGNFPGGLPGQGGFSGQGGQPGGGRGNFDGGTSRQNFGGGGRSNTGGGRSNTGGGGRGNRGQ
ncbi:MAG: hypothetical protein JSS49_04175 [Planctomycetes bacterium]|nr:hypothetical protein [Planctomycetota bacterium]